jgi:type IV pilus assembly protein PilA
MRTFIKNYIDAKKRQKLEETGEEGFSLIELIIVVVILGILVAVAIPLFASIQDTAEKNALSAAAANGATAAAASIATGGDATAVAAAAASAGSNGITVALATAPASSTTDVSKVCVRATGFNAKWAQAGSLTSCASDSW